MNDSDSLGAIQTAMDLGINFIDRPDAYGAGYSETLLGKALNGKHDKVVLDTNPGNRDFSVSYISRVLGESLKWLGTDYMDLYQLHNPTV
jgi:aryl-alcohol dehydrogenase-like predicted oxidoreductase